MKRTIITIMMGLLILSTVCANAQDVIVKKDNSTIISKVTKVSATEIEYKKWSNQDGPTYIINTSEVICINYQNGEVDRFSNVVVEQDKTTEPANVQQQVIITPHKKVNGYMKRAGNDLALDGRDLSDEEVRELIGEENYETYLSAKKQFNAGRTFTVITIASFVASVALIATGVSSEDAELTALGVGIEVLADISLITAIVTKSAGKGRLNWVAEDYNKKHSGVSFNISPSVLNYKAAQMQNNYGVGLTLRMNF